MYLLGGHWHAVPNGMYSFNFVCMDSICPLPVLLNDPIRQEEAVPSSIVILL